MDISKVELPDIYIRWSDSNLWIAVCLILLKPFYWNVIARIEFKTKIFSRAVRSRYVACGLFGVSILGLGVVRDLRFKQALDSQPEWSLLHQDWVLWSGYLSIVFGMIFVLSSFLALGYYGTFLGDYFGILMKERVTGFPYNVLDNPMYWGTTLNFVGTALINRSQAGLFLCVIIILVYKVTISFEGPFTTMIYAERTSGSKKAGKKQV